MGSGADAKNRVLYEDKERVWVETMKANDKQIGGNHYKSKIDHWDFVLANDLGYLEGCITKYVARWRKKNGLEDLKKAQHYLEKLIEVAESEVGKDKATPNESRAFLASTI